MSVYVRSYVCVCYSMRMDASEEFTLNHVAK